MRYNSYINNVKASEWGLNIKLAYLFSWMYELPSWASSTIIEGELYYFASKNKALEELPLLSQKRDTIYRYYKELEKFGLIKIKKIDEKDYVTLTQKGKTWNKAPKQNVNPKVGNLTQAPSDKNPTNNIISLNNERENSLAQEIKIHEHKGHIHNPELSEKYMNEINANKHIKQLTPEEKEVEAYKQHLKQQELEKTKKEKPDDYNQDGLRPYAYMKQKSNIRYEQFYKEFGKKIKDPNDFLQSFNDKYDYEGQPYDVNKIFFRLKSFARNWLKNEEKNKTQEKRSKFL